MFEETTPARGIELGGTAPDFEASTPHCPIQVAATDWYFAKKSL